MNTGARLGLYGLGLVVAFGGAFAVAGAAVPESLVAGWQDQADSSAHGGDHAETPAPAEGESSAAESQQGVTLDGSGLLLTDLAAPSAIAEAGELSMTIRDAAGEPVTAFTPDHERDLHLIAVRSDGSEFRHVHPTLDAATGTWSTPWEWDAAGNYRVFADFTTESGTPLTLSSTFDVAGDFAPVTAQPSLVSEVDGFTVTLDGDLTAGTPSEVAISVARDGKPVTALEPYLGAYGHLVALRSGDLAFMHVHAEGEAPKAGSTAGPELVFTADAPTAGRYLLYLDFQVDGTVHTAEFVVDAAHGDTH